MTEWGGGGFFKIMSRGHYSLRNNEQGSLFYVGRFTSLKTGIISTEI